MIYLYTFQLTFILTGNQLLYQKIPELIFLGLKLHFIWDYINKVLMKYLYTLTQLGERNRSNE